MMLLSIALLSAVVAAAPRPQSTWEVTTCTDNILILARGSTEGGNVGSVIGSPLCKGLKQKYNDKFSCQGIGTKDGYPAAIGDNARPKGTCDGCISGSVDVFKKINAKCPNAKLMFMGYSQGGALMSNVIPQLPAQVKGKIIGGVIFGSTRPKIDGIARDVWASYCASGDGVCNRAGNSGSTGSHLSYSSNGDVKKAIEFLGKKIDAAAAQ